MRTLRYSLASFAAFLSLNAFAEDSDNKTFCSFIRDAGRCVAHPYCFWDADDNRCEGRFFNDLCNLAGNIDVCVQFPACFWDASDNRCERR